MTTEELAQALEEKRPEMVRLAAAKLRRHGLEHDAEDFVQDAVIEIMQGVVEARYTVTEGIGPIFATVILKDIANRLFVDRRRVELTDEYTRIYQPDSQAQIQQRERLKIDVELALDRLDKQTRQIVRLMWMEGHTRRYVDKLLKISEHTVQGAPETALPILRLTLAQYDHRHRPASVPAVERLGISASQAPYKEEVGETPESTAPWAAMDRDEVSEMAAEIHGWFAKHIHPFLDPIPVEESAGR